MPYEPDDYLSRHFQTGSIDLAQQVAELARNATPPNSPNKALYQEMFMSVARMAQADRNRWDAKIMLQTLREMEMAFSLLEQFKRRRKVTVFGSARTPTDHPLYGLARQLAQNFHKGFAQFKRLRRGIQSQHPHRGAAPFRPCQPEGQRQGQRAGAHVHQQSLAALRSHRAGVGQGQACQQAREAHEIPGQKIIQIGADGGRGTPVRTRQPGTLCGQEARELGHVIGQRALVPRIERPYLGQGFGQHIQDTLGFSRKRREQRSGGRPGPRFKRTRCGALILALEVALPGRSNVPVALALFRPECRSAVAVPGCIGRTSVLTAVSGAVRWTPVVTAIFAVVFSPPITPCITAVILPP